MPSDDKDEPHHARRKIEELPERKRLPRDLSFGLQQTIVCWITDAITDPLFSMLSQNNKYMKKIFGDESKDTTFWEQVKSEVVGDLLAFITFVPLRRVMRKPFDAVSTWVERKMDNRFDKLGHKALHEWAERYNLGETDPIYQARLTEYKNQRAHNVVDSSIIGVLSLGYNTLTQKVLFKSAKPWALVAVAKTIGMFVTVASTLGFKTYMPKSSRKADHFLEERVFSKTTDWLNQKSGADDKTTDINRPPKHEEYEERKHEHHKHKRREKSHADRVGNRKQRDENAATEIV